MTEFLALPNGIRFVNGAFDLETETANTPLSLNAALENFRGFIVLNNNPTGLSCTDDQFLVRCLRSRKLNIQEALKVFVNYCAFVQCHPELFVEDATHDQEVYQALQDGLPGVLQRRDQKGRRVMVIFAAQWNDTLCSLNTIHKAIYKSLNLLLADPSVQEKGLVLIIDWSHFTLRQCSKLHPTVLRLFVEGLEYSYPVRFISIHCVGQPWYIEAALALLKPFLRESSRRKVYSHGNNVSSLHRYVAREILPSELGGEEGSYTCFAWIECLKNASKTS